MQSDNPKRRPRFSLLNLLLLVVVIALSICLAREHVLRLDASKRLLDFEKPYDRFRPQVTDRSRLFCQQADVNRDPYFWGSPHERTWSLFVPPKTKAVAALTIEETGEDASRLELLLEPGYPELQLTAIRDDIGEEWTYYLRQPVGYLRASMKHGRRPPWSMPTAGLGNLDTPFPSDGVAVGGSAELMKQTRSIDGEIVTATLTISLIRQETVN